MTKLEALAKDCIENHTHRLVDKPTKQDIYLREESIFIQGYRQSEKKIAELEKENAELKEFYEKEYFEIADRTADEKIKELEKYQTEVTVDDYSPYDENTWGMMHEEMFVPKELVRVLLKESYALSEHRNDQLTKAKEIIREFMKYEINEYDGSLEIHFEELKKQAEHFLSEVEK